MIFFKLLLIFALVFFGTFGQRFLRHSINDALIDGKDSDENLLSSDGINAQQESDDVKLTGFIREIELEMKYHQLKFEFCSKRISQNRQRCMDKTVFACYDAKNPSDIFLQDGCGSNQCKFEAGVSEVYGSQQRVWFMDHKLSTPIINNDNICPTAIMQSPKADVTLIGPFTSCEPLLNDGKIKLYAIKATPDCFLTVVSYF
uniref:Uncharacterized protein n=1 Tax=Panagrolaimus davidi TaxID=227884 RepID=A0A914PTF0_9BILA